jgi:hypothetical protein
MILYNFLLTRLKTTNLNISGETLYAAGKGKQFLN